MKFFKWNPNPSLTQWLAHHLLPCLRVMWVFFLYYTYIVMFVFILYYNFDEVLILYFRCSCWKMQAIMNQKNAKHLSQNAKREMLIFQTKHQLLKSCAEPQLKWKRRRKNNTATCVTFYVGFLFVLTFFFAFFYSKLIICFMIFSLFHKF